MTLSRVLSMIQDLLEVQGLEKTVKASYSIVAERQTKGISLRQELSEAPIIPAILKTLHRKICEQACRSLTHF